MEQGISIIKKSLTRCPKSVLSGNNITFIPLSPDGSVRQFFRVLENNQNRYIAVLPPCGDKVAMEESLSAYRIGDHLFARQIPVPRVFWYDQQTGLILFEDLGDQRVHDIILTKTHSNQDEIVQIYEKIIEQLVKMQFSAAVDFKSSWCYDTEEYDVPVMIRQESEYFEKAFLNELAGVDSRPGLAEEFVQIAEKAAAGRTKCFLHRDFQSRNIMVNKGKYYFIDFQGGRIGPPGYDLASLLNDPYVSLQEETKKRLFTFYLEQLESIETADVDEFVRTYPYLALQRNLQIIGAFSFLYAVRKKTFFKQFIMPALLQLQQRLDQNCFDSLVNLKRLAMVAGKRLDIH